MCEFLLYVTIGCMGLMCFIVINGILQETLVDKDYSYMLFVGFPIFIGLTYLLGLLITGIIGALFGC